MCNQISRQCRRGIAGDGLTALVGSERKLCSRSLPGEDLKSISISLHKQRAPMTFGDSWIQDVTEEITNFVRCRFCKGQDSKSIGKSLEEIHSHLVGHIDLDWLEHLTLEVTNLVQRRFSGGAKPEIDRQIVGGEVAPSHQPDRDPLVGANDRWFIRCRQ